MDQVNFRLGWKSFTKVAKSSISSLLLEMAPTMSSIYRLYKSEIVTVLPINKRAQQCPLALNQAKTSPSMSGGTVQCVYMSATQWPVLATCKRHFSVTAPQDFLDFESEADISDCWRMYQMEAPRQSQEARCQRCKKTYKSSWVQHL